MKELKTPGLIILLFWFLISTPVLSQQDVSKYFLDLTKAEQSRVIVEFYPPPLSGDQVFLKFPKIIPGSYRVYDFGRFIHNVKAYSLDDEEVQIKKTGTNTWEIPNPESVFKIVYEVEKTFGAKPLLGNPVFQPAGTNIEKDKNFLLNNHGFFGYIPGLTEVPIELHIAKPTGFVGASALTPVDEGFKDVYFVESYFKLVDSPIMYSKPDIVNFKRDNTDIIISVYSESGKMTASNISKSLEEVIIAIEKFFGGVLPVDKYAFLFYFAKPNTSETMFGALEHMNSSVYFLRDMDEESLDNLLKDVGAHEFMHILTPLNLHSEEIANFDYDRPKLSKHLWLYEGVTEYFSMLIQVLYGVISQEEFVADLNKKLVTSKTFNDTLSFTRMSENVLDTYQEEFINVYNKGALIAACLDLKLRDLSNSSLGLEDVMDLLLQKYGIDKPFKDDELFDEITEMTFPEIGTFFARYVEGNEPLPYAETFALAGINYNLVESAGALDFGRLNISLNLSTGRFIVNDVSGLSGTGAKLGIKIGDELERINGKRIYIKDFGEQLKELINETKPGTIVDIDVARIDKNGRYENVKLKARAEFLDSSISEELTFSSLPTDRQKMIRKAWIGLR